MSTVMQCGALSVWELNIIKNNENRDRLLPMVLRSMIALMVVAALADMHACKRSPPAWAPTPAPKVVSLGQAEDDIAESLRDLLERPVYNSFVILEDVSSEKFVQFIAGESEPLLLDLPVQTLSATERKRAEELFAAMPGATEEASGFLVALGDDTQRGAAVAMQVFREVYLFEDSVKLKIIEN